MFPFFVNKCLLSSYFSQGWEVKDEQDAIIITITMAIVGANVITVQNPLALYGA